jgi:hypothetical protein
MASNGGEVLMGQSSINGGFLNIGKECSISYLDQCMFFDAH